MARLYHILPTWDKGRLGEQEVHRNVVFLERQAPEDLKVKAEAHQAQGTVVLEGLQPEPFQIAVVIARPTSKSASPGTERESGHDGEDVLCPNRRKAHAGGCRSCSP